MFRITPFFIGLRYILSKKDKRIISFTSLISMGGLTLGVLALVIVLAVFNGAQGEQRERTLITVPHADVTTEGDFTDWPAAIEVLRTQAGVISISPYTQLEAMLSKNGVHQVTEVKGIDPLLEMETSDIEASMIQGNLLDLQPGQGGIVLGRRLAASMRLLPGDTVNLLVPELLNADNRLQLNMHSFRVVGIFDVRFTIGSELAYIHLADSADLLGIEDTSEAIRLRLRVEDIYQAPQMINQSLQVLNQDLPGPSYQGQDWSQTEASLFNALRMEKIMTWFMLMMIVAIGAFNIISTLIMLVSEKKADIAILRTMGAGENTIMGIFMIQGLLVGVSGTALGAILGLLIASNFGLLSGILEALFIPEGMFMLSIITTEIHSMDVIITCVCALLISFLATLYPAWKASRIHPAEVLRYE
jgi:lipoprotein-releasing system permease protein